MTLNPIAKKAFAAIVVAAPLTLVACGSGETGEATAAASDDTTVTSAAEAADDEDENTESSTSEEESEESAESAADEPSGETEEAESDGSESDGPETGSQDPSADAQAAAANAPSVVNQSGEGDVPVHTQQPVESPAPASEADVAAINDLVGGAYEQTTLRGWVSYIPENSCQPLLDDVSAEVQAEVGTTDPLDFSVIPETPLNQIPEFTQAQPSLQSVDNVAVNGNQASADVTVSSSGQSDTSTMRFMREGDNWTFCSDQYAS